MTKIKEHLLNEEVSDREWQEYVDLLKQHDFLYTFSDDDRVARKGRETHNKIKQFRENLTGENADKALYLYLRYMMKDGLTPTAEMRTKYEQLKYQFGGEV